jgi:hypothetical protein
MGKRPPGVPVLLPDVVLPCECSLNHEQCSHERFSDFWTRGARRTIVQCSTFLSNSKFHALPLRMYRTAILIRSSGT